MASTDIDDSIVAEMEETFGMVPPPLSELSGADAETEWPFFQKYTVGESEIPPKYRELMGLAVAANIKCPYCTHFHTEAAKLHGASEEELQEVVSLASLTPRYSAMLHARQYDLDEFQEAVSSIADHMQAIAADD